MIQDTEDSFPRGGKEVATVKRKQTNDTLFGNVPKRQKKDELNKKVKNVVNKNITLNYVEKNCPPSILPSISNFFDTETKEKVEESSSESEDEEENPTQKKKKVSPENKAKQNKSEDTKDLQEISEGTQVVENAEQYEKLLMINPNSSNLWLKYIAFCLSIQEFEKARSIGRRALASIDMSFEDDKFNIWFTLLSIEIAYGTKESFENVFDEAVKHNDAFKVYMKATDILFKSDKHVELKEKMKKMRMKFKQEQEMWVHIAKIYYLMGNFKEARNMKNMCLKSITIKKEQFNLILKFAILEFAHGEVENGILIFENVIITYPNKVVAWLVYIDQLISKKLFKDARDVLNRVITLPVPLKTSKTIYDKYRLFEEKYGTPETLAAFKEKAKRILQDKMQVA